MSAVEQEDRFTDWRLIGTGGMAEVYKVRDNSYGQDVAIKLLNEKYRHDAALIDGLRIEVVISRMLRHSAICAIHEAYEGPRGFGIVMDLLQGGDLKDWLKENNRRLLETLEDRFKLLIQTLDGLDFAHQYITHKDLKPANIWLNKGEVNEPLILDFGISAVHSNTFDNKLVASQEVLAAGTLQYMAPEQLLKPEVVDNRSDLFSFGIMAYEILTGGRIPPCSLKSYMRDKKVPRINIKSIPPPSTYCSAVPPAVDQIILQSLAYHRLDRPQKAADMKEVLVAALKTFHLTPLEGSQTAASTTAKPETYTVPAGSYFVGSPPNSEMPNELPQRRVNLSSFEIALTPITNRQYQRYLDATGVNWPELIDDPVFGASDSPVVSLTWKQASEYAAWIGGKLPTEIQWEVAAKAGQEIREFPWGEEEPGPGKANIDSAVGETTSVQAFPHAVNEWGLVDMCGNVWEWCRDNWDDRFFGTFNNDVLDPVSDRPSASRSIRGGSFESFTDMGRCAFRHSMDKDECRPDLGFRIVFESEDS